MGIKDGAKAAVRATVATSKKSILGYSRGVSYPFLGARFVYFQHPELVRFWAFPILITILAFVLVGWGGWAAHEPLVNWMWSPPTDAGFWGSVARFFHTLLEWLVMLTLWISGAALIVAFSTVIAAPFNELLSEEVECLATGAKGNGISFKAIIRDTVRSASMELVKLFIYLTIMVPTFLLSWLLPAVGQVIYSIFAFLFTALYFAVDFIDWPASRRNRSITWRFSLLGRHFMPFFGFGTGVWVFLFLPVVNLLFMPAAVAGGTLLFLDLEREAADRAVEL